VGSGASRVAAEPARATYLIFLFCRALVSLVRVPAETEWVAGWVQENPDVLLWLGRRHRGSQRDRLSNRGIEVPTWKSKCIIGRCSPSTGGQTGAWYPCACWNTM
jgi:hypothetical protein